jgi:hypothetical protein
MLKPIFTAPINGGLTAEYQKKNDGRVYWRVVGATEWYDSTDGALSAYNDAELNAIILARQS